MALKTLALTKTRALVSTPLPTFLLFFMKLDAGLYFEGENVTDGRTRTEKVLAAVLNFKRKLYYVKIWAMLYKLGLCINITLIFLRY